MECDTPRGALFTVTPAIELLFHHSYMVTTSPRCLSKLQWSCTYLQQHWQILSPFLGNQAVSPLNGTDCHRDVRDELQQRASNPACSCVVFLAACHQNWLFGCSCVVKLSKEFLALQCNFKTSRLQPPPLALLPVVVMGPELCWTA